MEVTVGDITFNRNTSALGAGGYGVVYIGKLKNQLDVAVKVILKRRIHDEEEFIRKKGGFDHENVAKMLSYQEDIRFK